MPAIGITGGISTGKSTLCACLRELLPDAKFFDADQAARALVDLAEVKQELAAEFGTEIFLPSGPDDAQRAPLQQDLNRSALRTIVFQDAAKKRALEQILHPRIRRQWSVLAETHRNSPDFFLADIPLLYETGGETLCDRVVVVACSRKIQLARLRERLSSGRVRSPSAPDGPAVRPYQNGTQRRAVSTVDAEQIIESQMPLGEKIRRADHVVWNNGERSVLVEQARSLVGLWGK